MIKLDLHDTAVARFVMKRLEMLEYDGYLIGKNKTIVETDAPEWTITKCVKRYANKTGQSVPYPTFVE